MTSLSGPISDTHPELLPNERFYINVSGGGISDFQERHGYRLGNVAYDVNG